MAAAERDRVALAAWLRRPGAGTFQRPARTLSATLRRRKHAGLQSDRRRAILSRFAAADETRFHQAARDYDAEEFAPGGFRIVPRPGIYQGQVPGNSRLTRSWTCDQDETRDPLFR